MLRHRGDLFCLAAIALLGAALYGHTLHVPWYMDDLPAIVDNPAIRDLEAGLRHLLAPRGAATLSFALNYRLGGLDPVGFHLLNTAIHLANGCLVYLLLKRVGRNGSRLPLAGALLFGAHPLQTQAVTYVVQRMTILSGLFFLLALYLFARAREDLAAGRPWHSPAHLGLYGASLLAGMLALLAKETAVVLPFALILYARFFLPEQGRQWKSLLPWVAPFLLPPLFYAAAHLLGPLTAGESLQKLASTRQLVSQQGNSPLRYLATEGQVLWIYLRLLVVPWGQALDHDYAVVRSLLNLKSAAGLLGLAGLGWLAWRLRCRHPQLAFAIGWFFLTLAVESSVIPLDPLVEHRLYLPMFGFAVALPALARLVPKEKARLAGLVGILVLLSLLTWKRNALWNDPVAFHEENLRRAPASERVRVNLARSYLEQGRHWQAEKVAREAIRINPGYEIAHHNLGAALYYQLRPAEALEAFRTALRLRPDYAEALHGAAAVSLDLGKLDAARGFVARLKKLDPQKATELEKELAGAEEKER
jgi:tetratricopeptide (TPR) repeat protein